MLVDQVAKDGRVDDVVVDDEVVRVLDVRKVHVCQPVDEHQEDAESRTDPDHQPNQKRNADQQMPVSHQKGDDRCDVWVCEDRKKIMKGLRMTQEANHAPVGRKYLMG